MAVLYTFTQLRAKTFCFKCSSVIRVEPILVLKG